MNLSLRLLSAGAVLLMTLSLARAQEQKTETPPISPERPGFTNGTDTVLPKKIQFETGYQYSRDGKTIDHEIDNGAQLRFGITPSFEFRLGAPAGDWISGGGTSTRGLGDSSLSVKWRFLEGKQAKLPSLAVIAGTILPTGSRGFRENHLQPQVALESHFDFSDKYSLEADVVYTDARSDGARFDQYAGGLNLGYNLSPATGLFIETYRISPTDIGSVSGSYVDGGITHLVGNNTQFDINGGTGVTRGVRSGFFVGAGISHRFK